MHQIVLELPLSVASLACKHHISELGKQAHVGVPCALASWAFVNTYMNCELWQKLHLSSLLNTVLGGDGLLSVANLAK